MSEEFKAETIAACRQLVKRYTLPKLQSRQIIYEHVKMVYESKFCPLCKLAFRKSETEDMIDVSTPCYICIHYPLSGCYRGCFKTTKSARNLIKARLTILEIHGRNFFGNIKGAYDAYKNAVKERRQYYADLVEFLKTVDAKYFCKEGFEKHQAIFKEFYK